MSVLVEHYPAAVLLHELSLKETDKPELAQIATIRMQKLNLDSCTCDKDKGCVCSSKSVRKGHRRHGASSSHFWRKTLRNPITKRPNKGKEILTPSKLKFILGPAVQEPQTSSSSSSSALSSTINTNSAHGPCCLCGPLRVQSEGPACSSANNLTSAHVNNRVVCDSEFLNDLNSLSLRGTGSDLDFKLQSALQITPVSSRTSSRYRRTRSLKWKNRIKCSLKDTGGDNLPTIAEDDEETDETFPGQQQQSQQQSCSQQALMETTNGSSGASGPVDDVTIDELASYFDDFVYIPKKMSTMAEMMYT